MNLLVHNSLESKSIKEFRMNLRMNKIVSALSFRKVFATSHQ